MVLVIAGISFESISLSFVAIAESLPPCKIYTEFEVKTQ